MTLSPIILFVYNRPWHTEQTIEALKKNELAKESELFIFSDGPKNEKAIEKVNEVRNYIKKIEGFKSVTIIEREKNFGLAANIIDGVTSIVNRYGTVIVLEDDLVTSPYFLKFMNDALDFYEKEKRVWHISGWNYPISSKENNRVFLWRLMNCWGWATWSDRWKSYEKNVDKVILEFSKEDIKRFNIDGFENFWSQILANKNNKINTWAIFWYSTIFKKNGLCLNPSQTFVENIGHDGSGVHCGPSIIKEKYSLNYSKDMIFEKKIEENKQWLHKIKKYYLKKKVCSIPAVVYSKLKKVGNVIK